MITNDTLAVLRTPCLNTQSEMLGSSETLTIKFLNEDSSVSLKTFLITNDTLVMLRTPHLNTQRVMLGRSETFTIKSVTSKGFSFFSGKATQIIGADIAFMIATITIYSLYH